MTQHLQHPRHPRTPTRAAAKLPINPHHAAPHAMFACSHPTRRFGRIRNAPTGRLPHFDHLKVKFGIQPQPAVFDYSTGFPAASGALYNDAYGDCAFAGHYHRFQVVMFRLTGQFIQGDDLKDLALRFYEEAGGFDPTQTDGQGNNPTDQGGDMEAIALFLMKTGLMKPDGTRDRYVAAFNVDPQNEVDMAFCAQECLGIGLGVIMTDVVMPSDGSDPASVWQPGGRQIGGHFVYSFARSADGVWKFDSWGSLYQASPGFMRENVDQVIAYVSEDALANGKTVMGRDLAAWQGVMAGHGSAVS